MKAHSRRNFLKYLFATLIFFSVVGVGNIASAADDPPQSVFGVIGNAVGIIVGTPGSLSEKANTVAKVATGMALDAAGGFLGNIFGQIFYITLWIMSFILGFIGAIFNAVFDLTVVNMAKNIESIKIINIAWTIVRDIANIFFIFVLIYLAIVTILQLDEHGVRHSLSRLIIAAVLINFSLFFVKIIIDVPNILAVKIYGAAIADPGVKADNQKNLGRGGLGDRFLSLFDPQKAFKAGGTETNFSSLAKTDGQQVANIKKNPLTTFVMGTILMAIACFVFLAVIIIFLKRFVVLIFLMAFSPLAFLGMALPIHDAEGKAKQFWQTLFKEAFYAPIFMMCVFITLKAGEGLNTVANSKNGLIYGSSWLDPTNYINFGNIISYAVVMTMLVASLIIAEEMAVSGASGAMTAYNGMKGAALGAVGGGAQWMSTNTVGRFASNWINSKGKTEHGDILRDIAGGNGKGKFAKSWVGRNIARSIVTTAEKVGKGFDEKAEVNQKWMEQAIGNRHGDHKFVAETFANASKSGKPVEQRKATDNYFHGMSVDQKANMKLHLEDIENDKSAGNTENAAAAKAALDRYYRNHGHGRLEADEVSDLARAEAEGLTYHDSKFREAVKFATDPKNAANPDRVEKMKKFFEGATEGQMLSAIKAVGAEGEHFDKTMQKELSDGLMKFQGESMISSITKDSVLSPEIKEAASGSMFRRKLLWDSFEALKGNEDKNGATSVASIFSDNKQSLTKIKKEIDAYETALLNGVKVDIDNSLKALTNAFEDQYSSFEASANYVINGNGRRTLQKSETTVNEIKKRYDVIDDPSTDVNIRTSAPASDKRA